MAPQRSTAMSLKSFGILLIAILLGAVGQLALKLSLNAFKAIHGDELSGLGMLLQAMCTPGMMVGLLCYVVSTLLYLRLMWDIPVSLLYPMVALNYVFVTLLAVVYLHEVVPPIRYLGLLLIIGGVVVYAVWGKPPEEPAEQPMPAAETSAT